MTTTAAGLTQRPVSPADAPLLARLLADAKPELNLLDPPLRDQMLDLQLRAQQREHDAAYPDATHEVLVLDGVDVGRLVLDETPEEVRVVDIGVLARFRGRGVATAALREVLEGAGDRRVRLSVWSQNVRARELYESLGFVAVGETTGEYVEMARSGHGPALHR